MIEREILLAWRKMLKAERWVDPNFIYVNIHLSHNPKYIVSVTYARARLNLLENRSLFRQST